MACPEASPARGVEEGASVAAGAWASQPRPGDSEARVYGPHSLTRGVARESLLPCPSCAASRSFRRRCTTEKCWSTSCTAVALCTTNRSGATCAWFEDGESQSSGEPACVTVARQ